MRAAISKNETVRIWAAVQLSPEPEDDVWSRSVFSQDDYDRKYQQGRRSQGPAAPKSRKIRGGTLRSRPSPRTRPCDSGPPRNLLLNPILEPQMENLKRPQVLPAL